tara:strand:- start:103 stop:660 length:558 start_codon:yes stop_codon:yes gene_type:complete
MGDIQTLIQTIPESLIQQYGSYTITSTFKVIHNGDTFCLPYYNFDVSLFCNLYTKYLKMLMDTTSKFEIYHINDRERRINLANESYITNETIGEYLYRNFHSNNIAFYILIQNTKQYNIERSLITNNSFEGECNICYQTTSLKHYYKCKLKDKNNHHGICGSCCSSWHKAKLNTNCPICRSTKRE